MIVFKKDPGNTKQLVLAFALCAKAGEESNPLNLLFPFNLKNSKRSPFAHPILKIKMVIYKMIYIIKTLTNPFPSNILLPPPIATVFKISCFEDSE